MAIGLGDTPNMYHNVEWTPERIERFWNFYGKNAAAHGNYFSRRFGRAILRFVRGRVRLSGVAVDLGCGPGYLVEELLRQGMACKAIDSSTEAVERVRERSAGRPGFLGGGVGTLDHIPLADGEAGTIFLIEVLEHLGPEFARRALAEMRRVLSPGGHLIITVPNAEDLNASAVACPDCGCVFHKMQHVQSFDGQSMSRLLSAAAFESVCVTGLNLKHFAGGSLARPLSHLRHLAHALRRRPDPHLLAIGRRPIG